MGGKFSVTGICLQGLTLDGIYWLGNALLHTCGAAALRSTVACPIQAVLQPIAPERASRSHQCELLHVFLLNLTHLGTWTPALRKC